MADYDEYYETQRPNSPAVGAALSQRISGDAWTRLLLVRFTLTASVVAANRFATVDILDGDQSILARCVSPNALTAGLARSYTFIPEASSFTLSAANEELGPISHAWFLPGLRIRLTAVNLDAGDQVSAASFYVCRATTGKVAPAEFSRPYAAP